MPFDFFVESRLLIEFDGVQHFQPIDHFGGEQGFRNGQRRDALRDQYARKKQIPLIRLNDDDRPDFYRLRSLIEQMLFDNDKELIWAVRTRDRRPLDGDRLSRLQEAIPAVAAVGLKNRSLADLKWKPFGEQRHIVCP